MLRHAMPLRRAERMHKTQRSPAMSNNTTLYSQRIGSHSTEAHILMWRHGMHLCKRLRCAHTHAHLNKTVAR